MVSRRPEAGSALGRGQRWGAFRLPSYLTTGTESGNSGEQPLDLSCCFHPSHTIPLSLLSDRTLACRCSTTCRQTLSFWLAGWHCWKLSFGQVTLRHPHPLLCRPSLTFLTSRKCFFITERLNVDLVAENRFVLTIYSYVWIIWLWLYYSTMAAHLMIRTSSLVHSACCYEGCGLNKHRLSVQALTFFDYYKWIVYFLCSTICLK